MKHFCIFLLLNSLVFSINAEHALITFLKEGKATQEDLITTEMLLESVEWEFVEDFYDLSHIYEKRRKTPGYIPKIDIKRVEKALPYLMKDGSYSFQVLSDRPIKSIKPLKYLPHIKYLVLIDNPIEDLSPISSLKNLTYLNLTNCKVKDISALKGLDKLEELYLSGNPVKSYSSLNGCKSLVYLSLEKDVEENLSFLPNLVQLKNLSLNGSLVDNLKGLEPLPELRSLRISYKRKMLKFDAFSFKSLPKMPKLRELEVENPQVVNLVGIEKFKNLQDLDLNIMNTEDISALESLKNLEVFSLDTAGALLDLSPLGTINSLKVVDCRGTLKFKESDFKSLKKLREINIRDGKNRKYNFKSIDTSWDGEFLCKARYKPSTKVKIITQKQFDYFDDNSYNFDTEKDKVLNSYEGEWVIDRIQKELKKFSDLDDYYLPYNYHGRRSQTVVINSEENLRDYKKMINAIQSVLSTTKKNWIIYLHIDSSDDNPVWVYPDHLEMVKESHENLKKYLR